MAHPHLISSVHPTERLIGQAPAILALRADIRRLATFDTLENPAAPTVLLQGETGTGKGLVARIIHESGPRVEGPFVEVNCAAIPEALLEAELFGFEAGAFTDARRAKPGLWEVASGGLLFLDEIDALPMMLQSKLLTVIEAKQVRRLGAVADHSTNVKLIAATQADLRARVAEGQFRADLYHRLAVVLLEVPPLRTRGADVVLLAQHALQRAAEAYRLPPKRLDPQAEMWLQRYPWPGNVRELGHLMERATLLYPGPLIGPDTLEPLCLPVSTPSTPVSTSPPEGEPDAADEATRIQHALHQTAGNVARAARVLGMSRGALRHRMARYRIAPSNHGGEPGIAWPQARGGQRVGPAVPHEEGQPGLLSQATTAPAQRWEQKPVAVLAVEVTWPADHETWAAPYEPWTVTSRWEQTIVEKFQAFGGVVLPHTPAVLIAAFGVPRTLEQAPERAVQAALALQRLVRDAHGSTHDPELRMALHYGEILVDTEAVDPAARLLPIGDTLAWPGRLLAYAEPGELLASPEIKRWVGGWCELRVCQAWPSSESPQRPAVYTIVGLRSQGAAWPVHRQHPMSRFVGREPELAVLEDLLARVSEGHGHVAGLIGEPGVGKSRLCAEFVRPHQAHGWSILETRADSYRQAIPYGPIVALLRHYFQLDADDDQHTIRGKITAKVLALEPTLQPILPALFALLEVPVEEALWQDLDPPQRRQRFLEAVKLLVVCESHHQPLILVAENLHWIDGETQGCLDHLVEALPAARVLLLVSYRPEYRHGWTSKSYYTQLRLDPLPPADARALLQYLLGDDAGLEPLKHSLIERTQGNPFFLEESVRTLVETQAVVGDPGAYHLRTAQPRIQVPATVHAVLAARIDHLPEADKRLLQTAAVIGTQVPFSLLQAIAEGPEASLPGVLAHLQSAEFLYETRLFPEREYTFTHALSHEVAYRSLVPERRRELHARIVEALDRLAGERVTEQVERLAHHALQGEVWDKALAYCRQAGEKAMARWAYREAVGFFEQALSALPHVLETRDTREQAVDLRLALRTALYPSGDWERLLALLREAQPLAESLDDPRRLGQVSAFLALQLRNMGRFDQAITAGERARVLARASGDIVLEALANQYLGVAYQDQDDYHRAIDCLAQSVAFFAGKRCNERFDQLILPAVFARANLALCQAELGLFAEGRALAEEGLRMAETVAHPGSLMFAATGVGQLAVMQGDLPRAIPWLERAIGLRQDMAPGAGRPANFVRNIAALGAAYTLDGRAAEAGQLLARVLEQISTTQGGPSDTLCHLSLGEAQLVSGCLPQAHAHAERAMALATKHRKRSHQAYTLRLLGKIAAQRDDPEVALAEAYFHQALALAEALGMRPLQAHCHLSLGTLYAGIDRHEQARAELSTALELYGAMDMTFWLPQVKAALARVL